MALWTPLETTTDLWHDAADATTMTIVTGVSEWRDKKGNGKKASQATGSKQPVVIPAGLNGLDVLRFTAASLQCLTGSVSLLPGATQATVFVVYAPRVTSGNMSVFGQTAGTGTNTWRDLGFRTAGAVGDPYLATYAGDLTDSVAISASPKVASYKYDGTTLSLYRHGALIASGARALNTVNVTYEIGHNAGGSYPDMDLAEIIVVLSVLSDADRQLFDGYLHWKWGLQDNLPADHPYKSAAPTIPDTTILRRLLSQPYALEGTLLTLLPQLYHLTTPFTATCSQFYGLQLLAVLAQRYGDVPAVRAHLEQYYGSADLLRRLLAQPYGDALQLCQTLVENWNLPGDLLAIMEMRYFISEGDLRALMSYNYDLSEYTLLRQKLEQIYIAGSDAEEVQEPLFSVTTNNGESLKPHHINIEIDEGEYAIKGEIHLADQNDFLLCKHIETEIIIPIDSTEYHLLVEGPRQSRPEWGRVEYYIPLASKTILLDSPYATPIDQEFTGALASVIVAGLAAIKSITVIWQLIDWYIPIGVLTANNESPLSIIRRVVNAVGGILQSSPAGELICLPEYPISTTEWETVTPDFYLTDMDNFFSVDSTSDIREGYNRFLISDKVIDESGLILEQVDIDENTKDIYVYQVPWNSLERVILHTSGGVWVSIVAEGITTEEITEIVEIIAGEGMTQKPFYSKVSHDYKETELGLITINEDKTVSTELSQNSLVEVVYNTKYWKFRVRDAEIEKVQFFPEAIAI